MALNLTGPISLAGATAGQSIAVELSLSPTGTISLNQTNVRTLAGVPTGAIVMPTNFYGKSVGPTSGTAAYTTAGTYTFSVPGGVTRICVVCVGGGSSGQTADCSQSGCGGPGGGLSYTNCIVTTPGESLTVIVGTGGNSPICSPLCIRNGCDSYINRGATTLIRAKGGNRGLPNTTNGVGAVRNNGGLMCGTGRAGGGGAAGFAGNGGLGGGYSNLAPTAGAGGGGGGGGGPTFNQLVANAGGAGGGGVGIIVQGANGAAGSNTNIPVTAGRGGSGGATGADGSGGCGGAYGAGGGGGPECCGPGGGGGSGAVRIIWGTGRSYPSAST